MIIFVPRAKGQWPAGMSSAGNARPQTARRFGFRHSDFVFLRTRGLGQPTGTNGATELKGKWTKGRSKKRRWHRFPEFHFPFPFVKVCLGTPCKPCSGTTRSSVSSDAIARYRVGHDGRHSRLSAHGDAVWPTAVRCRLCPTMPCPPIRPRETRFSSIGERSPSRRSPRPAQLGQGLRCARHKWTEREHRGDRHRTTNHRAEFLIMFSPGASTTNCSPFRTQKGLRVRVRHA